MTDTPPAGRTTTTTGASVLAGGLWNAAALVLPQFYTLVVSVTAARFLGPTDMGRQSFISFVQLSLFLVLANGMPAALQRFSADLMGRDDPGGVRKLLGWAIATQVITGTAAACLLAGVGLTTGDLTAAWSLAGLAAAAATVHAAPASLLVGLQRWRDASVMSLVSGAAGVAGTVGLLAAGLGITGIFLAEATVAVVNTMWAAALARRALRSVDRRPPTEPLRGPVARYAALSALQTLINFVVWRRSEFFFLARWQTAAELAMYSVAFAMAAAALQLPRALTGVFTPAVANLYGAGQLDRVRGGVSRSLRLLLVALFPLAAGGVAVGPPILRLFYGAEYGRAADVVIPMLAGLPLISLFFLAMAVLQGLARLRPVLVVNGLAAAVNIGLDVALIPAHGAMGASVANTIAQCLGAALLLAWVARTVGGLDAKPRLVVRGAIAGIGAGVAAALPALALGDLGASVGGVAAGAAAYVLLALALRPLARGDAVWLADTIGPRVGLRGPDLVLRFAQQPEPAATT